MMKTAVWMSFDLGVNGDYEGLYQWLDAHEASACGDSVAFFNYEAKGDLPGEIKKSLAKAIDVHLKKTRIYSGQWGKGRTGNNDPWWVEGRWHWRDVARPAPGGEPRAPRPATHPARANCSRPARARPHRPRATKHSPDDRAEEPSPRARALPKTR